MSSCRPRFWYQLAAPIQPPCSLCFSFSAALHACSKIVSDTFLKPSETLLPNDGRDAMSLVHGPVAALALLGAAGRPKTGPTAHQAHATRGRQLATRAFVECHCRDLLLPDGFL